MSPRVIAALGLALISLQARAELYYVIVGGLGGQADYAEQFANDTDALAKAARRTVADESRIVVLDGDAATHDAVTDALEGLASRTKPADSLAVFLIGHGSFDGDEYKFNLPGPDISGSELKTLLDAVPAKTQLIVNATSASGALLEPWEADGRTVITATRSGRERTATRFGRYWAEALSSAEADVDKDGAITAQEAFDFASRRVADSFESEGALATEHPQLEGDAAARFLAARLVARDLSSPELVKLYAQLDDVEGRIDALRERRDALGEDAYLDEFEKLAVELAEVQKQIDEAGGSTDTQEEPD